MGLKQARDEILVREDQHFGFVIKVKISIEGREYGELNSSLHFQLQPKAYFNRTEF